MPRESLFSIKNCTTILMDLQLGLFQKYKNIQDIKTLIKQWIMVYATESQPFFFAVHSTETKSEIYIRITVESQLLGGIDLNK